MKQEFVYKCYYIAPNNKKVYIKNRNGSTTFLTLRGLTTRLRNESVFLHYPREYKLEKYEKTFVEESTITSDDVWRDELGRKEKK